ncbi:MAG: helix-turn-helix domain-containing protein [Chloroflexi bacterium]|nr:helix-turn-helix domain-containing protein [Chloroflexota bacterium]
MAVGLGRQSILAPAVESEAIGQLARFLDSAELASLRLIESDGQGVPLPEPVARSLADLVRELARGRTVRIEPIDSELSTQQAAELLNVSRPFVIKLLDAGEIPYHFVGTHRRIRLEDLLRYKQQRSQRRRAALAEMAREAQESGLYE